MVYTRMMLCLCISLMSCASKSPRSQDLVKVYHQGIKDGYAESGEKIEEELTKKETFGYVKPYMPIVKQPIVRKVWIPDESSGENREFLVSGHWTYIMIQPAQWFIDEKISQDTMIIPQSSEAEKK